MPHDYTTDVDFPSYFVREQAPLHISLALALLGRGRGFRPEGYRYADFGCGSGLTLTLLAAANPNAEFVGLDINPEHIRKARELAGSTGVSNVSFHEADFTALGNLDLHPFDYIAVSGVFSWLDAAARARLVRAVAERLRPEGVCYVQYTTLPSAAISNILGVLTQLLAAGEEGNSAERVLGAVGALSDILKTDNLQFNQFYPMAAQILERQSGLNPNYLAHDVLNSDPHGLWFHETARSFEAEGLSFAGQARIQMNVFDALSPPALADAFNKFCTQRSDPVLREEMINLLSNANVRMDLYTKTDTAAEAGPDGKALADVFVQSAAGPNFAAALQQWRGKTKADFSLPIYTEVLTALASGGADGADLFDRLAESHSPQAVRTALSHLFGVNLLVAGLSSGTAVTGDQFSPSALERHLILNMLEMPAPAPFPSKLLGGCFYISLQHRILLAAMLSPSLKDLWASLEEKSVSITVNQGARLNTYEAFEQLINQQLPPFKQNVLSALMQQGLFQST